MLIQVFRSDFYGVHQFDSYIDQGDSAKIHPGVVLAAPIIRNTAELVPMQRTCPRWNKIVAHKQRPNPELFFQNFFFKITYFLAISLTKAFFFAWVRSTMHSLTMGSIREDSS